MAPSVPARGGAPGREERVEARWGLVPMSLPLGHASDLPGRRRAARPRVTPEWVWPEPLDEAARQQAARLERHLGLHPLVAEVLVRRGLGDPEAAHRFLHPRLEDLESPWAIPGMEAAVARVEAALAAGERICVYGDYDVDGQTATALLVLVLRRLGAQVAYHLPNRLDEGYGLHRESLLALRARGTDLVVTVDCGITAREEVAAAREAGLDVVVTDHHQVPEALPEAAAVVNPRLAQGHPPWLELAGVGVAWKLAQALLARRGREEEAFEYLDLVALGTVADVVPLVEENRILVAHGLRRLGDPAGLPGLARLIERLGLQPGAVTPGQVAFQVAPRLNAAGRVEDATLGVRLLLAPSAAAAEPLAEQLDRLNRERQALEGAILEEAREQAWELVETGAVSLVVAGEGWHPGVVGIVASRLVEEFYRPTLVIGLEDGESRGSARSVAGFHLYQALAACQHHLIRFGGHAMAAGFALAPDRVPALREAFEAVTRERLGDEPLRPRLRIDCFADPAELDGSLLDQWAKLAPFGVGNPEPLLGTPEVPAFSEPLPRWLWAPERGEASRAGLTVAGWPEWRRVGREGDHLKGAVPLFPDGEAWEAIAFHLADRFPEPGGWLDLAFRPTRNAYRGVERLELEVRELQPSPERSGSGWAALAAWLSEEARDGPLLVVEDGPGGGEEWPPGEELPAVVDQREEEGLPFWEGPVTFYTPDLWEAVELVQALRWQLKGERERVAFLGPLGPQLEGKGAPPYQPPGEALWAVATAAAPVARREGPVVLWSPPWTREGWRRLGRAAAGRPLVLRFSRGRLERLQRQVEMLYPGRQRLVALYRYLRSGGTELDPRRAAEALAEASGLPFAARTVQEGLAVLAELGLLTWEEEGGRLRVHLAPPPGRKLDLNGSVRYTKGIRSKRVAAAISEIALSGGLARVQDLLRGGAGPWT